MVVRLKIFTGQFVSASKVNLVHELIAYAQTIAKLLEPSLLAYTYNRRRWRLRSILDPLSYWIFVHANINGSMRNRLIVLSRPF